MNTNSFNLCPVCVFNYSCVLTSHKSQVWSCSEFEEGKPADQPTSEIVLEPQLELVNH